MVDGWTHFDSGLTHCCKPKACLSSPSHVKFAALLARRCAAVDEEEEEELELELELEEACALWFAMNEAGIGR